MLIKPSINFFAHIGARTHAHTHQQSVNSEKQYRRVYSLKLLNSIKRDTPQEEVIVPRSTG